MPLVEETLSLVKDIYKTYKEAPPTLKRHYLRYLYERFVVENGKVVEAVPTPILDTLLRANSVRFKQIELENRNFNITKQLACIIKTFEDFRLVAQIREEIEKVKPALIYAA